MPAETQEDQARGLPCVLKHSYFRMLCFLSQKKWESSLLRFQGVTLWSQSTPECTPQDQPFWKCADLSARKDLSLPARRERERERGSARERSALEHNVHNGVPGRGPMAGVASPIPLLCGGTSPGSNGGSAGGLGGLSCLLSPLTPAPCASGKRLNSPFRAILSLASEPGQSSRFAPTGPPTPRVRNHRETQVLTAEHRGENGGLRLLGSRVSAPALDDCIQLFAQRFERRFAFCICAKGMCQVHTHTVSSCA